MSFCLSGKNLLALLKLRSALGKTPLPLGEGAVLEILIS